MKHLRRFLCLLLSLLLVLSLATVASAATITIQGDTTDGSTYKAWCLLNVEMKGDQNKLYDYTVNETYRAILKEIAGVDSTVTDNATIDKAILLYIANQDEAAKANEFASAVYEKVKNMTADGTTTNDTIENVSLGYYLIAEEVDNDPDVDNNGVTSLLLLNTANIENYTIDAKEDKPTMEKKIWHDELSEWQDVGDDQIGDEVKFRITSTVPSATENYETYTYSITDTLSAGLTLNSNSIVIRGGAETGDDNIVPDDYYTITYAANDAGFTIDFNIKKALSDSTASHLYEGNTVYVLFSATLNEDAQVIGTGYQTNTATLEYSNNPYDEDSEDTITDVVYEFSFYMDITKVDPSGTNLEGAKFVLSTNDGLEPQYENNALTATTDLIGLVKVSNGYRIATPEELAVSEENSVVTYVIEGASNKIVGLDDATDYYLYEVEAPEGYNKLEDPVKFKITASYTTGSDGSITVDNGNTNVNVDGKDYNALQAKIENKSGALLPSTGGMGTTLFYIIGAALMLGAAVLLITKRRMNSEQ